MLIANSPDLVQKKLIQNSIEIPTEFSSELEVKIAESEAELEAAYHLLYNNYIEMGYEKPNKTQLRVIPHHLLPTTTTILAKLNNKVVGSMSIIKDGVLGLPMESSVNLSEVRLKHANMAEISSLSIHKDVRRAQGGIVFFPLLKFMYEYCVKYANIENLIILVRPHAAYFYKGLMHFEEVPNSLGTYLGVDTVALKLNLNEALTRFQQIYSKKKIEKNLYHFFVEQKIDALKFPDRRYFQTTDTRITPDIMKKFFLDKSKITEKLTVSDYLKIKNVYKGTQIFSAFTEYESNSIFTGRKGQRFDVKMNATLTFSDSGVSYDIQALSVSSTGLKIQFRNLIPITFNSKYVKISVQVSNDKTIPLSARHIRKDGNQFALEIISPPLEWHSMIDELTQNHKFSAAG